MAVCKGKACGRAMIEWHHITESGKFRLVGVSSHVKEEVWEPIKVLTLITEHDQTSGSRIDDRATFVEGDPRLFVHTGTKPPKTALDAPDPGIHGHAANAG